MASQEQEPDHFAQCQHCGKKASPTQRVRACTRCYSVGYCSRACQKSDWTGKNGHKSRCRPRPTEGVDPSSPKGEGAVVRLEVKRGDEKWEDVGPINLVDDSATMIPMNKTGDILSAPVRKNAHTRPNLTKGLPKRTQRILGPDSSNTYTYRHSPDGVDENLLIFFHGAGDSHLPYDALGGKMQLPQTAVLSLSASLSPDLSREKKSKKPYKFVELPFGLGYTWFEEMDYSTGEILPKDSPRRSKSLKHALYLLEPLVCSLTGIDVDDGADASDTIWIPERIFFFGFSAGGCLVMEFCRMWMNAGRMPLGGAICVAGGVSAKEKVPDEKGQIKPPRQYQTTDVLIFTGKNDATYPVEAARSAQQLYHSSKVQIHVEKGKGHSMLESKDEMRVVMEFLSKRLVRRMVSLQSHVK